MTTDAYPEIPPVSTVPRVAEILDCSERHVRNLIARGDIRALRIGRLVKIPRHVLLDYIGASNSADSLGAGAAERNQKPPTPEGSGHDPG